MCRRSLTGCKSNWCFPLVESNPVRKQREPPSGHNKAHKKLQDMRRVGLVQLTTLTTRGSKQRHSQMIGRTLPHVPISLSHYLIISLCPDFIDRKLKTPATDSSIFSSHGQWPMKRQKVAAGSVLSHGNIGPQADTWVVYHTPHIPHIPRPLTSGFWGKGNQADQKLPRG